MNCLLAQIIPTSQVIINGPWELVEKTNGVTDLQLVLWWIVASVWIESARLIVVKDKSLEESIL